MSRKVDVSNGKIYQKNAYWIHSTRINPASRQGKHSYLHCHRLSNEERELHIRRASVSSQTELKPVPGKVSHEEPLWILDALGAYSPPQISYLF